MTQLRFFFKDINRILGKQKFRIIILPFNRVFWGIFIYRIERSLFLITGPFYKVIRIIYVPLVNILQAYSNLDINYNADIKGGLSVLHPSMGVVISGHSVIGENLTLTGGNVIGAKHQLKNGDIFLESNIELGANAVVLGPIHICKGVKIGASACVVRSCFSENATIIGVPGRIIHNGK